MVELKNIACLTFDVDWATEEMLYDVIQLLETLPKENERVFPITDVAVRQAWDRLRRRAGITDLTFHDLRHEAVSRFFESGLSIPQVMAISGHQTASQLFRYIQLSS